MDKQNSQLIIDINAKLDCNQNPNKIGELKTIEFSKDTSSETAISKNSKKIVLVSSIRKEDKKTTKNTINKKIIPLEKPKGNILLSKKRKLDSSIE